MLGPKTTFVVRQTRKPNAMAAMEK